METKLFYRKLPSLTLRTRQQGFSSSWAGSGPLIYQKKRRRKKKEERGEERRRKRSRRREEEGGGGEAEEGTLRVFPCGHWLCGHPVLWYYLQVRAGVLQRKDVPVTLCHAELIAPGFQRGTGLGVLFGVSMTSAVISPESPVILARAEEVAENPPLWGQLRLL